jgi:hypothetical protein
MDIAVNFDIYLSDQNALSGNITHPRYYLAAKMQR